MTSCSKILLSKSHRQARYLTKSLVRTALTCRRKLVYATQPDVYPPCREKVDDPIIRRLSEEGERFGKYCQSLFPHGVEINPIRVTNEKTYPVGNDKLNIEGEEFVGDRVALTRRALLEDEGGVQRVTLFEGAVTNGNFYVQPDILDKIVHLPQHHENQHDTNGENSSDQRIEIRVIEVKSKSWDSRQSIDSKMWNGNKKSIKANHLPNILDVAFQTLVVRRAFPNFRVTSWLMMPDKAKVWKAPSGDERINTDTPPTVADTESLIKESVAVLLNVDELVEKALATNVTYPGSENGNTFQRVVEKWAQDMNEEDLSNDKFKHFPIGANCGSCEYRLTDDDIDENSGFDVCWSKTTGLSKEELRSHSLVIDLFDTPKRTINNLISQKKYFLSNLEASDLQPQNENNKKNSRVNIESPGEKISGSQRQWYQVLTARNATKNSTPQYILREESMKRDMASWEYPLHFIDFETTSPAIPYYFGVPPYSVAAFQFSHHKMIRTDDGSVEVHHANEFLHTENGSNPNENFTKALFNAIGDVPTNGGTVFRWSAHENTVLSSLLSSSEISCLLSIEEHAALSALLKNGSHAMIDLCKLAQDYFYVDGSGGSSSIKKLLTPTMTVSNHLRDIYEKPLYNGKNFKDFQWFRRDTNGNVVDPYELLLQREDDTKLSQNNRVAHGIAAAAAFHELQSNNHMDASGRERLKSSLLRYCELDTLAMVMIVQAWQGFLDIN